MHRMLCTMHKDSAVGFPPGLSGHTNFEATGQPSMKRKNLRTTPVHLDYLYSLALVLPYRNLARCKARTFLGLSLKRLHKLKKVKSTICKGCAEILIPKATCRAGFVKRECGLCFEVTCLNCRTDQRTVVRGEGGA